MRKIRKLNFLDHHYGIFSYSLIVFEDVSNSSVQHLYIDWKFKLLFKFLFYLLSVVREYEKGGNFVFRSLCWKLYYVYVSRMLFWYQMFKNEENNFFFHHYTGIFTVSLIVFEEGRRGFEEGRNLELLFLIFLLLV